MNLSEEEKKQAELDQYFKDWNDCNVHFLAWLAHPDAELSLPNILRKCSNKRKVEDFAISQFYSYSYYFVVEPIMRKFLMLPDISKIDYAKALVDDILYLESNSIFQGEKGEKYNICYSNVSESFISANLFNFTENIDYDINSDKCMAYPIALSNLFVCMKKFIKDNSDNRNINMESCFYLPLVDVFEKTANKFIQNKNSHIEAVQNVLYQLHFRIALEFYHHSSLFNGIQKNNFLNKQAENLRQMIAVRTESDLANLFLRQYDKPIDQLIYLIGRDKVFFSSRTETELFSSKQKINNEQLINDLKQNLIVCYCSKLLEHINGLLEADSSVPIGISPQINDAKETESVNEKSGLAFDFNSTKEKIKAYYDKIVEAKITLFDPLKYEIFENIIYEKKEIDSTLQIECEIGIFALFLTQMCGEGKQITNLRQVLNNKQPFHSKKDWPISYSNLIASLSYYMKERKKHKTEITRIEHCYKIVFE